MKALRFPLLAVAALLLLSGCAPAESPAPSGASTPAEPTREQSNYMYSMGLGGPPNSAAILPLVSFPADASYTGPDYRLTLCAVYADYADKRVLVKMEPVSEQAKAAFAQESADTSQAGGDFAWQGNTPHLYLADADTNETRDHAKEEVALLRETDARYYYLYDTCPSDKGFVYLPREYYDGDTGEHLAELTDISIPVDLSSPIESPLVFALNLPIGEDGTVLDTLTLGVLSTHLTFHCPLAIRETVTKTLSDDLESFSVTWTDQAGTETEFSPFRTKSCLTQCEYPDTGEEGGGTGNMWPRGRDPLPLDQVASLQINGVSYLPQISIPSP